jgi:general secretion pathway protein L
MSVREGLIVTLPEHADRQPLWMRVLDGAVVQGGAGAQWLHACGLSALPSDCVTMLVPPAGLTALHWIAHPEMPVRQGRAAARIAALSDSIAPVDALMAAVDENDDQGRPHVVAIAERADMQHWLLWARDNGFDPDLVVPAALLLPEPEDGYVSGTIGGTSLLRGQDVALPAEDSLVGLMVDGGAVTTLGADAVNRSVIAALETPPLNMRQGEFAKRTRLSVDRQQVTRIAVWCGFIALASLLIALIAIVRYNGAASSLDADSLTLARTVLPDAEDAESVEATLDQRLAERGAGAYTFTGPVAGLFTAMQGTPSVSLTRLSRGADGLLNATLASARAEDINAVLLALQSSGFTITATSSSDTSGRVLADITVRP